MPARRRGSVGIVDPRYILLASILTTLCSTFLLPKYLTPTIAEAVLSLLFFLAATYLMGYTLTKDAFESEDHLEVAVMRVGFGLSTLPILFILLENAHVPQRWYIILGLSLLRPLYDILCGVRIRIPRVDLDVHTALAFLITALAFTVALWGSYTYPYLEDGDSWEHAVGAKYVSIFGKYTQPEGMKVAHYLPPYPPTYDTLMGVILETNSSVSWTLKTFNSLLVALSYIFAYYLVRKLSKDNATALFATLVLFMLPPFGSHTIWSHTLSALLMFTVLYAAVKMEGDWTWTILAAIFLASSLIVQPLMSFVTGIMWTIYVACTMIRNKKETPKFVSATVAGLLLSMIYWAPLLTNSKIDMGEMGVGKNITSGNFRIGAYDSAENPTTLITLFPLNHGDIYMQHGFGLFAVLLAAGGLDLIIRRRPAGYLKENPWLAPVILWLMFTITFLFSAGLPIALYPLRFWGIAAVPLAMLAGYMLAHLREATYVPKKARKYVMPVALLGLLIFSAIPKMSLQLSGWPTDLQFKSGDLGYVALTAFPAGTPVYPFCNKDAYVIGLDKMSYPWDNETLNLRGDPINVDYGSLHDALAEKGFKWVVFDSNCIDECMRLYKKTEPECQLMFRDTLKGLDNSGLYKMKWRSNSTLIFQVQ